MRVSSYVCVFFHSFTLCHAQWHCDEAIKMLKMPPPPITIQAPKRQRVDKVSILNNWEADKRSERGDAATQLERGGF